MLHASYPSSSQSLQMHTLCSCGSSGVSAGSAPATPLHVVGKADVVESVRLSTDAFTWTRSSLTARPVLPVLDVARWCKQSGTVCPARAGGQQLLCTHVIGVQMQGATALDAHATGCLHEPAMPAVAAPGHMLLQRAAPHTACHAPVGRHQPCAGRGRSMR